jgi:TRAP-type C4-dicarboxylate transport system substrate-binding protein
VVGHAEPAEKKVLQDAAIKSREFERKDTREEAAKALADIKAKGMQVNELPAAEAGRMRDKLTAVNTGIAKTVGQGTWDEVQAAVKQARAAK